MTLRRLAPAPPRASTFAFALRTAYNLTYSAQNWSNEITLPDGRKTLDVCYGNLLPPSCPTMNEAQDAGIEWALKKLKDHIRTYDPPLNTKEEVDAEFGVWQKSSSEQGNTWSYTVSKGDAMLIVTVRKSVEAPEAHSFTYKFERMD